MQSAARQQTAVSKRAKQIVITARPLVADGRVEHKTCRVAANTADKG